MIRHTMMTVNRKDYTAEEIETFLSEMQPKDLIKRAEWTHFYVVADEKKLVGCGAIGPYWGRTDESSLFTVFVLPEYQGNGIGRAIVETLEKDPFCIRASRMEVPASVTAVEFYRKMGYTLKKGIPQPDEEHLCRMEKHKPAGEVVPF